MLLKLALLRGNLALLFVELRLLLFKLSKRILQFCFARVQLFLGLVGGALGRFQQ